MENENRERKRLFSMLMWLMTAIPILLLVWYVSSKFNVMLDEYILPRMLIHMSEQDKGKLLALLAERAPGIYTPVPEPSVGRVLQMNTRKYQYGTEITSNNAGMRSKDKYTKKEPNKYRIVCLGDSFVFGMGGKEEDRYGSQIEDILEELKVRIDGKEIEVYNLGIPSWSAFNEATYLISRLSHYEPDIVLVLMVSNDISDSPGVSGIGQMTYGFSPDNRQYGSGVFLSNWPSVFGVPAPNLLRYDLGTESRMLWEKTFTAWKRLETLLSRSDRKMIFGVLDRDVFFTELSKYYYERSGMTSPFILMDYFGASLSHDPHPNAEGHRILALHYLHTMNRLGWLPVDTDSLPALDQRLKTATKHAPNLERLSDLRAKLVEEFLEERLSFANLSTRNVQSILGGMFPAGEHESQQVFSSIRSGFLLRRKRDARNVLVKIKVPPYAELYPFKLEMSLNGQMSDTLMLDNEKEAGIHLLEGIIPKTRESELSIEVLLRTESYWTTISDPRMRSHQMISAYQE